MNRNYIWKKNVNYFLFVTQRCTQKHRSSRPEVFCKKGVLRSFAKFTGKHLCQSFFFNKIAGLNPATLLKNRLWHRCFPVNFTKLLRTFTSGGCFWESLRGVLRILTGITCLKYTAFPNLENTKDLWERASPALAKISNIIKQW